MKIYQAFNQGQVPTISCINKSTVPLGNYTFPQLIATLQKFLDTIFVPVWGTPAILKVAKTAPKGTWQFIFFDDADQAGALGYHDLTSNGLPLSKIFVKTTIGDGENVSTTACHELAEMMVDPGINMWADTGSGTILYAYEMCDAVEALEFKIDGIPMSDFVYPSYFEGFRKAKSVQFDYLKKITKPFQILPGGYSIVQRDGQIQQLFGSRAKEKAFKHEDRRLHRSEYRKSYG